MEPKELFTQEEQKLSLRNQYEAVIYFMAHLDIEMVSSFLDDDKTYQDFPKYLFVSKLIKAFEYFEKVGIGFCLYIRAIVQVAAGDVGDLLFLGGMATTWIFYSLRKVMKSRISTSVPILRMMRKFRIS